MTLAKVATRFGVSPSYVSKVRARLRVLGDTAPGPQHNHVVPRLAPLMEAIRGQVAAEPDAKLREVRAWLVQAHNVCVSHAVLWKAMAQLGMTHKKYLRAAEQDRADVVAARKAWAELQPTLDPDRLVFLDETWATTSMARSHGWASRGKRLVCAVPHGHWHTTTFLCGLRAEGLVAPLVLDGAVNGAAFLAYVEQFLAPTLTPGDVVILGNLRSHKVAGVQAAIEACGARLLHLPPALQPRPEPHRVGLLQAQAPAARRRRAHHGRALDNHRQPAQTFSPKECASYIRRCGFAQSNR